jgi:hypothetical protein
MAAAPNCATLSFLFYFDRFSNGYPGRSDRETAGKMLPLPPGVGSG